MRSATSCCAWTLLEELEHGDPARFFLGTYLRTTRAVGAALDGRRLRGPGLGRGAGTSTSPAATSTPWTRTGATPPRRRRAWRRAFGAEPGPAARGARAARHERAHQLRPAAVAGGGSSRPEDFADPAPAVQPPPRPRAHRRHPGRAGRATRTSRWSSPVAGGPWWTGSSPRSTGAAAGVFLKESRRKVWANASALHAARLTRAGLPTRAGSPTSRWRARRGSPTCCARARCCCGSPSTASASAAGRVPAGRPGTGPHRARAGPGTPCVRALEVPHDRSSRSAGREGGAGDRRVVRHRRGDGAGAGRGRCRRRHRRPPPRPAGRAGREAARRRRAGAHPRPRRHRRAGLPDAVRAHPGGARRPRRPGEQRRRDAARHDRRRRPRGLAADGVAPTSWG